METIADRIKAVVESSGLLQSQIAAALGVDGSYISRILSGKSSPSLAFLARMAAKYNVSLDYIILGINKLKLIPNINNMTLCSNYNIIDKTEQVFMTYSKWNSVKDITINDGLIFDMAKKPKNGQSVIVKQSDGIIVLGRINNDMLYFDNGLPPQIITGDIIATLIKVIKIV